MCLDRKKPLASKINHVWLFSHWAELNLSKLFLIKFALVVKLLDRGQISAFLLDGVFQMTESLGTLALPDLLNPYVCISLKQTFIFSLFRLDVISEYCFI